MASNAVTEPSDEPAYTTPPATAGWAVIDAGVVPVQVTGHVALPHPAAGRAASDPLDVGTYRTPSARAGDFVIAEPTDALHFVAPLAASRA